MDIRPFKVGDYVYCKQTGYSGLANKVYRVESVHHSLYCIKVETIASFLSESRFRIATVTEITDTMALEKQGIYSIHLSALDYLEPLKPRKGVVINNPEVRRCECGSESVGSNMHSTWCGKFEKF